MDAHWWWLTAAIVLAIAELVVPGAFLIWIATAAALTGVAALLIGVPLAGQFVLFALLSVASLPPGPKAQAGEQQQKYDKKGVAERQG